jgi:hypothetical protein
MSEPEGVPTFEQALDAALDWARVFDGYRKVRVYRHAPGDWRVENGPLIVYPRPTAR